MKNLVLITSVIDPPDKSLSYSKIRSVFTKNERFEQTKKTIQTIKEKIPDCHIMITECSDLNSEEEKYFKDNSTYFLNLFENQKIIKNVYSKSKSLGEGTLTIESLNFLLEKSINYDNFIKISGRYWLNENFNFKTFNNESIVCLRINNSMVNTVLYKFPYNLIKEYLIFLKNKIKNMIRCIGYETLFSIFLKNKSHVIYLDSIGCEGYVTVCGSFWKK